MERERCAGTAAPIWRHAVSPLLTPFVDCIWGMSSQQAVVLPCLLPGTGAELFLQLGTPFLACDGHGRPSPLPALTLLALRTQSLALAPAADLDFIAVRFKAGMAARLLGLPVGELIDTPQCLTSLGGLSADKLLDQLHACAGRQARIVLLEGLLLQCLQSSPHFDMDIALGVQHLYYQAPGVEALARQLGMSGRQLARRFMAQEGISPVQFRLLARFQRAARLLCLEPALPLVQVAAASGYADQAHLTRSFRALLASTPERVRRQMRGRVTFYARPGRER
ncbi:AraC-type DNA-binding protein [Andreprevotia lacus DSM 23236]|jgi:AraC-like DNA-binding protein|uniref:AraC-type DNA-binding protein n=1 Tax=Andreprevotia lacus DSM 23236 TaxID=1121001 RepID=A0A1W1XM32_9NEIS|nr:helix-turn-helix domain-containing protein [Andreprevotia lacus]SMC25060.1 AraC-type DNA-binding protein [Andreprevotia lacus DSM 23236]